MADQVTTVAPETPDSAYMKTVQQREDIANVRTFLNTVNGMSPEDRALTLTRYGQTEDDIKGLTQAVFYPNAPTSPAEAQTTAQKVEGKGGGQTTDVPFASDPVVLGTLGMGSAAAGAGLAIGAGAPASTVATQAATQGAGTILGQVAANKANDLGAQLFPNHPQVAGLISQLALSFGLGALQNADMRRAQGAVTPEPAKPPQGTVLDAQGQPMTSAAPTSITPPLAAAEGSGAALPTATAPAQSAYEKTLDEVVERMQAQAKLNPELGQYRQQWMSSPEYTQSVRAIEMGDWSAAARIQRQFEKTNGLRPLSWIGKGDPINALVSEGKPEEAQALAKQVLGTNAPAAEAGAPAPVSGRFHGTSTPIDALQEDTYSPQNTYGQGFYTTDNQGIAEGYSGKGKGGQPTVYNVAEKPGQNLLSLDETPPSAVQNAVNALGESKGPAGELGQYFKDNPKATLRDWYDEMRGLGTRSSGSGFSADDVQEEFTGLQNELEKQGYSGLTHVGGKNTGNAPHQVNIYWNPKASVDIAPQTAPAPVPSTNGAPPPSIIGAQTPAPATAEAAGHTDVAYLAKAAAQPLTREEMTAMPIVGEAGHELPAGGEQFTVDMMRTHSYVAEQLQRAIKNARLFRETGDPGAAVNGQDAIDDVANLSGPRVKAYWHQAGLMLQKSGATEPANATLRDFMDAIEKHGTEFDDLTRTIATMNTPAEREAMINLASKVPWSLKGSLYQLYLYHLLSFNSVAKKGLSDVANIALQTPIRGLAEVGSRTAETLTGNEYGSMGVSPGETMGTIQGIMSSWRDALSYGAKALSQNKPAFSSDVGFLDNPMPTSLMEGSGFEGTWWGRGIDYYGHLASIPARAIMSVDQFSKAMQYNISLYALAHRQGFADANAEGYTGTDLADRAALYTQGHISNPPDWMVQQAFTDSKINTFTQDLEGNLKWLDEYRQKSVLARTMVPFFKTPVNLTLQAIRNGPAAAFSPYAWREIGAGGPDAALRMSKIALGSALTAYFAHHVLQGNITGGMPNNLSPENRILYEKQHPLYSFKGGKDIHGNDKWHSYQGLEPIAEQIGFLADIMPHMAYADDGEAQNIVQALGESFANIPSATAKEFKRQAMWGAIHAAAQILDNTQQGEQNQFWKAAGHAASSAIPVLGMSSVANVAGYTDPVKRQTFGTLDTIRNRNPFLKANGLPTLDKYGDNVIVPPGLMYNELPAFKTQSVEDDPVTDEYLRLQHLTGRSYPAIPEAIPGKAEPASGGAEEGIYGASVMDVNAKGDILGERVRWQELVGHPSRVSDLAIKRAEQDGVPLSQLRALPSVKDALAQLMASDGYQASPDPVRMDDIQKLYTQYITATEPAILYEFPQIQQRIMEAYQRKQQLYTPKLAGGSR